MRTTISIPEPLLKNAKRRAAERGITLSALIEDAMRRELTESQAPDPPPFRLYTVRGKLVNPNLDLDRTSGLVTLDDEAAYSHRRS